MVITEPATGKSRERVAGIALAAMAVVVLVAVFLGTRSAPQMGADEEVFRTVDALFTAVTSRDDDRLNRCEQRLKTYRTEGKLPTAAGNALDEVIRTARAKKWQPAAERLYQFMRDQRRDTPSEMVSHRKERAGKKGA